MAAKRKAYNFFCLSIFIVPSPYLIISNEILINNICIGLDMEKANLLQVET